MNSMFFHRSNVKKQSNLFQKVKEKFTLEKTICNKIQNGYRQLYWKKETNMLSGIILVNIIVWHMITGCFKVTDLKYDVRIHFLINSW